ncbi:MAG: deaminase [Lentisphaeraceae bacterium]|nr:deaminase [Lentisphaeraceae bacterium]
MDFLVIGMVMGVGTDKDSVIGKLKDNLSGYGYESNEISSSQLIKETYSKHFSSEPLDFSPHTDEYSRILAYMNAGDKIREDLSSDLISLAAIAYIRQERKKVTDQKQVFLITNLKHPDEVKVFRAVYGNAFYMLGLHSTVEDRREFLLERKNIKEKYGDEADFKIDDLFEKDDAGSNRQSINKTFHLSDYFIQHSGVDNELVEQINRFNKIIHSYPFETPTKDEHFMFMAYTTSLRSSDLSRQVGAVLVSEEYELISTGANEVPKYGGGLFWSDTDTNDDRDYIRGKDTNHILKNETILKVYKALKPEILQNTAEEKENALKSAKGILGDNLLFEMSEYNRAVHAEMEALLACARISGNSKKGRLYTTTFPCHNCAKHIIAAGVQEVIYIEPYTKSKATTLYKSLTLSTKTDNNKVFLKPFIGMGPRRYFDLFSTNLGSGQALQRKDNNGKISEWQKANSDLRLPLFHEMIDSFEKEQLSKLNELIGD